MLTVCSRHPRSWIITKPALVGPVAHQRDLVRRCARAQQRTITRPPGLIRVVMDSNPTGPPFLSTAGETDPWRQLGFQELSQHSYRIKECGHGTTRPKAAARHRGCLLAVDHGQGRHGRGRRRAERGGLPPLRVAEDEHGERTCRCRNGSGSRRCVAVVWESALSLASLAGNHRRCRGNCGGTVSRTTSAATTAARPSSGRLSADKALRQLERR